MAIKAKQILNLLKREFDPSNNTFGRGLMSSDPLTFDQVNSGRAPVSKLLLVRIPYELQSMIFGYLDKESWATLAQVNKDCCQLARSRQFQNVLFDYSLASISLLDQLIAESAQPKDHATQEFGQTQSSIGICIRRVTVSTDPRWLSRYHAVDSSVQFQNEYPIVPAFRLEETIISYERYFKKIEMLFSTKFALPNLELLQWEERIPPSEQMFTHLISLSIPHLKLHICDIDFEVACQIKRCDVYRSGGPKTLYLSIEQCSNFASGALCLNLLEAFSGTLESLTWTSSGTFSLALVESSREMTYVPVKLQTLQIRKMYLRNQPWESLLFSSSLVNLSLSGWGCDSCIDDSQSPIFMPMLQTFIWKPTKKVPQKLPLKFLNTNSQIEWLSILSPSLQPTDVETVLLPLLSSSFRLLTSINLIWPAKQLPASAIIAICKIKTLHQICLTARSSMYSSARFKWKIDHNIMRIHLCSLPRLRKIAFFADDYKFGAGEKCDTLYNRKKAISVTGKVAMNPFKEHRLGIIQEEARKYGNALPNLQWIYLCQVEMYINRFLQNDTTILVKDSQLNLSRSVKTEWRLLRDIFGGELVEMR